MALHNHSTFSSGGFSFIEILLSAALLVSIAAMGIPVSVSTYRSYVLHSERKVVEGLLRTARAEASNRVGNASHGVYIGEGLYVRFTGDVYIPGASGNIVTPMHSGVTVHAVPSTIVFTRGSAAANTMSIELHQASQSTTVIVNAEGYIE